MYENQYGYGGITGYQQPMRNYGMQYPALNQMQNMQQMQQTQASQMQLLKGRPVSSYEEASASMIDMDGSLFVFTDVANKQIYTKQIMLDGTADLKVYRLVEQKKPISETRQNSEHVEDYVSRSEFDKVLKQINRRFDDMEVNYNVSNADDD